MISLRRFAAAPAAVLVAAACLAIPSPAAAATPPPAFLIMPFENTGEDPGLAWLANGLALHTGEHLRGRGAAVVEEEDRAVFLEGQGIPAGAGLTLASALELGRTMRARPGGVRPDRLVLGRYAVQEGSLTLSVRVIDLATERARPWITREARLKDLLDAHASLVDALARDAGLKGHGDGGVVEPPLIAFESYCRALAESDLRKRLALLKRSLQEWPGYPLAAYQAALVESRSEQWKEAGETLASATSAPHPYEADFHLLQASVAIETKDPAAATQAARRALEIADSARGHALLGRALAAAGDRDSAQEELNRATAIDPSEPEIEDLRRALGTPTKPSGRTP
ncbi:MAG TPA: tetratricopeptide repeat protein [Dongiaceae bacterium]|nr:tetratricopeptide repeat protein [Dongiaceae bacterium]